MKNKLMLIAMSLIISILYSSVAFAQELDDFSIGGLELEKVLNLGSGILATALLAVTWIAFQKTKNKRLLYVSAAFLLFAVKGFLTAHELFFEEWPLVDPIASLLNFGIILCFFFGVMKK